MLLRLIYRLRRISIVDRAGVVHYDNERGAGGIYNPNDCSGGHYDHIHVSVF